ncbi:hypothetical protein HaLaN_15981, partial [Haematococcus lacustris]
MLEHPPGVDDGEELAPGLEPEEQPAKAAMTATAGTAVSQAHAAAPQSHVAGSHAQDAVYAQRMPPGYQDYFSDYYSAYAAYGPDGLVVSRRCDARTQCMAPSFPSCVTRCARLQPPGQRSIVGSYQAYPGHDPRAAAYAAQYPGYPPRPASYYPASYAQPLHGAAPGSSDMAAAYANSAAGPTPPAGASAETHGKTSKAAAGGAAAKPAIIQHVPLPTPAEVKAGQAGTEADAQATVQATGAGASTGAATSGAGAGSETAPAATDHVSEFQQRMLAMMSKKMEEADKKAAAGPSAKPKAVPPHMLRGARLAMAGSNKAAEASDTGRDQDSPAGAAPGTST